MAIDILSLAFFLTLIVLGWSRGLVSQLVTIGAAVVLWFTRDVWVEPVGGLVTHLGAPFEEHPFLREMAGFVLLYLAVVLAVALIERKVIERVGPLRWSNHWLGGVLGGAKGLVYLAVLLWTAQAAVLWRSAPEDSQPAWLSESRVMSVVGPWNPVRMFTLQEVIDEVRERLDQVETDPRKRRILESPAVQDLLRTQRGEDWGGRGYPKLASDPQVRRVVREPGTGELLFGN